jgi:hypothetical protein
MSHNYCICGERYTGTLLYRYNIFLEFKGIIWQRVSKLCLSCERERYHWIVYNSVPEITEAKIGKIIILAS